MPVDGHSKVHLMPLYGHVGARRLVRTFIAVPTPEGIVRKLVKLTAKLQFPGCKLRWSTPEQMHLTVQFLGNVEWIEVGKIGKTIKEVAAAFPPLDLRLSHLTIFPPRNQPRVIVAALEPEETLSALAAALQERLHTDHQIVPEKRAYRPHITLGRVKSVADTEAGEALRAELAAVDSDVFTLWSEWEADELTLFQSDLEGGRPEYIELSHATLKGVADGFGSEDADDDEAEGVGALGANPAVASRTLGSILDAAAAGCDPADAGDASDDGDDDDEDAEADDFDDDDAELDDDE